MSNFSPEQTAALRAASKVQARLQAAKAAGDKRTVQLISLMGVMEILQIIDRHPLVVMFLRRDIDAVASLMDQIAETLDTGDTFSEGGEYSQLVALLEEDHAIVRGTLEAASSNLPPQ